uniref:Olfactory receptor n=1 Tax=Geotrypetes seraphini TaxID=260995 RepID=A0A6P8PXQ5_GEOSA|nr:olfactory receptor 1052-like [Geotrypetes seraphini]
MAVALTVPPPYTLGKSAVHLLVGIMYHMNHQSLNFAFKLKQECGDPSVLGPDKQTSSLNTINLVDNHLNVAGIPSQKNSSQKNVEEFFLLGISDIHELQILFYLLFLLFYLITMVGNASIIVIIRVEPRLQTPMYFFLTNLSFIDMCYSSVTVPKILVNLLAEKKLISFGGCIAQMYFFHILASSEMFLLVVMAYDRYVAICNPLRYPVIINKMTSVQLAAAAWLGGFVHSTLHTMLMLRLSFCGPNEINHFFCDATPLLKLSCSDTTLDEILLLTTPGILGPTCFLLILISYSYIINNILKISSAEGRQKTFSTCASHVIVVTVFYGTGVFVYIQPMSIYSSFNNKFITIFYAVITPMLNPVIYTLRNKDVKGALKKILYRNSTTSKTIKIVNIPV